jgi:hypothetical protein
VTGPLPLHPLGTGAATYLLLYLAEQRRIINKHKQICCTNVTTIPFLTDQNNVKLYVMKNVATPLNFDIIHTYSYCANVTFMWALISRNATKYL